MPATTQALAILVLVMTPGYLANLVASRTDTPSERSDFRYVVRLVAFGVAVHFLAFPITQLILREYLKARGSSADVADFVRDTFWWILFAFGLLGIVGPLVVGIVGAWISDPQNRRVDRLLGRLGLRHLGRAGRTASGWQWVADKEDPFFVRVYLTNGEVIGGGYGCDSLMSIDPDYEDIYLEQMWILDSDDDFDREIPTTRGVWIPKVSIRYVEFLEGSTE